MKKIITIVGARPQFIKASTVSRRLKHEPKLKEIIVHTGQHYDPNMSQIFFDELEIPHPDYQLNIGSGSQAKQTGEMLVAIENILIQEKPDYVLIYGDTNSTLAGALAAAKLHVPIMHVEAGLRSYNRHMPEEINRIVADQLSHILFTPTQHAVTNLKKEGYSEERIIQVGDVMYDAALFYAEKSAKVSTILKRLQQKTAAYILATIHRAENTDHPTCLNNIFTALEQISHIMPIIVPLHPRTRKSIEKSLPSFLKNSRIQIIEPVSFLDMVMLEKNAALIMTDSGGVQKEAFFYKVPCITLRNETEWTETIELGWNRLASPENSEIICHQVSQTLGKQGIHHQYPYGHGEAAKLIVNHFIQGL